MTRPNLPARTRSRLQTAVEVIEGSVGLVPAAALATVVTVGLHAATGDPGLAWLSGPVVLVVGLAASVRTALIVAAVLGAGHLVVDLLVLDARPATAVGAVVRAGVLLFLADIGGVGAHLERQRHRAMERAVSEDPVTGLLNVRVFYDQLAELRRAREPFAILLADLRGMRDLNDRYGHPTGTEAMRVLAHVLRRATGPDAQLARLGSDEIAVLVPGADLEDCRRIVATAVDRLASERVQLPDGTSLAVHASYGISRFPDDGEDEVVVLRTADRVKDRAKATGLDPVGVAGSEDQPGHAGDDDPGAP